MLSSKVDLDDERIFETCAGINDGDTVGFITRLSISVIEEVLTDKSGSSSPYGQVTRKTV